MRYCRAYMMPYPDRVTKDGEYDLVGNVNEFFSVADEIQMNVDQYQGILDFTLQGVIMPMLVNGEEKDESILARFRPLRDLLRVKVSTDVATAVTLFVMLAWNDGRHFLYPARKTVPVTDRLLFELRRLAQNGLIWTRLVRLIFMGASNLAGLVGAKEEVDLDKPPEEREHPDMVFSEVMGRTTKRPWPLEMKPVLRFGHVYEALGRQLIEQFMPEFVVVETGTGVCDSDPLRNQSADGLLIKTDVMKGRAYPADFPTVESDAELLAKLPTASYVIHRPHPLFQPGEIQPIRDNSVHVHYPAAAITGIVEIKLSARKWHCYDQCPLIYLPQVFQAMHVQGADKALFISIKYFIANPIGRRDVEFTMEWIYNDFEVQSKLQRIYNEFSKCVMTQSPELSALFWDAHSKLYSSRVLLDGTLATSHTVFDGLKREYAQIRNPWSGLIEDAHKVLLPLHLAVGESNALDWINADNDPSNVEMNRVLLESAAVYKRQLYGKNKRK